MKHSDNRTEGIPLKEGNTFIFTVSLCFLLLAFVSIVVTIQKADDRIRHVLLISVNLIAESIQKSDLEKLVGGKTEEQKLAAARIQEQLSRQILSSDRFAYIYIMERDANGDIRFLVDAQRPENETPPAAFGELYPEASDELKAIFDNKTAFVEGPLQDSWGTWVSPIVPIIDPDTGEVQAVLGLDFMAKLYYTYVYGLAAAPTLLFALLVLLGLSLKRLLENRRLLEQTNAEFASTNNRLLHKDHFERLLVNISLKYINRPLASIDQTMESSLGEIGSLTDADRAYIFEYHLDANICRNTHEWCAEGISPEIDNLQSVALVDLPGWLETHQKGEVVNIPEVQALPRSDPTRSVLESQNIKSLITVPLIEEGVCIGFVGFDSVRNVRQYSSDEQQLLEVFAEMIVNVRNRQKTGMALQASNEELERQTQLAKEMADKAQRADLAKSAFLAAMSHEIRTPLNAVIGMTSLMLNTELSEEQSNYASSIHSSGNALLELINDILDFSKIEAGHLDLNEDHFQINDCIDQPMEIMKGAVRAKNVSLEASLPENEPCQLKGDLGRIRQIVLNLLSNAIRFSHTEGRVLVNVSLERLDPDNRRLIIEVTDNGIGISEAAQKNLFKAFIQADSSITRSHGGTGLGLAISRRLARLMNGDLFCQSQLNEGSTFRVEIPLSIVNAEEVKSLPRSSQISDETPTIQSQKNDKDSSQHHITKNLAQKFPLEILIVEDNPTNQKIIEFILRKMGYTCNTVANGQVATEAVTTKRYDLILMDLEMPVMDGIEATRTIRINGQSPLPIIVALSANVLESRRKECFDAGMNDFLSKPIRIPELNNVIMKTARGEYAEHQ
jgi:signal transduction histidine kinase/ActR/RegA family two-component response regulator